MGAAPRLAAFGLGLALVAVTGYGVGSALGPEPTATAQRGRDMAGMEGPEEQPHDETDQAGGAGREEQGEVDAVTGLSAADAGLRLVLPAGPVQAGDDQPFAFQVVAQDGAPLTDYEVEHEKELHFIAVRRDGSGFQHVHPELVGADWTVDLDLTPGSWRVFADFVPAGADEGVTLGADVQVAGDYAPRPVPAAATVARVDDLVVTLDGSPRAGAEAMLDFTVTRDGAEVTPDPYLGARGHLVALREGDLAYLHVHPDSDSLSFMATFPTQGRYLLFLDLSVDGTVRTAPFTVEVTR